MASASVRTSRSVGASAEPLFEGFKTTFGAGLGATLLALVAVVLVPIGLLVQNAPGWEFIAVAALCALIVLRHAGTLYIDAGKPVPKD